MCHSAHYNERRMDIIMTMLNEMNLKTVMWIVPIIFFIHEMEEWNILDWYHSTYVTPPPSTKLSCRLWLWTISIWGFLMTTIAYVIPNKSISAMVLLILIVFTTLNGLQHIYWLFAFHKYAPGVIGSSIGIVAGGIITAGILVQNLVSPIYVIILYLITVPYVIQTIRAKNTLLKTFYALHLLTVKIANCFQK